MSESKKEAIDEFWLFHDIEKSEITELRKFIDPDLDLKPLKGFDKILDQLNHLIK